MIAAASPPPMPITRAGETFEGYNKPKRTPKHPTKSHAVLAKDGGKVRLIRFGQQGVSGSPPRRVQGQARPEHRQRPHVRSFLG